MKIHIILLIGLLLFTYGATNAYALELDWKKFLFNTKLDHQIHQDIELLVPVLYTPPPTPTPIPTPEPTPTPVPVVRSKPASPTPVANPAPAEVPFDVVFTEYAGAYQVSKDLLVHIAKCESRFRPDAGNGQYQGMFQYSPSTWVSTRTAMGLNTDIELRNDPVEAIRTSAFKIASGGVNAWKACLPKN